MALITNETMNLKCILTNDEKNERKDSFREWYKKKIIAESDKKSIMSKFTAIIKECDTEMSGLDEIIQSGEEKRPVNCYIRYEWGRGIKTWIREDTGEIVKQGIISAEEMQQEIKFDERLKKNEKKENESTVEVVEVAEVVEVVQQEPEPKKAKNKGGRPKKKPTAKQPDEFEDYHTDKPDFDQIDLEAELEQELAMDKAQFEDENLDSNHEVQMF